MRRALVGTLLVLSGCVDAASVGGTGETTSGESGATSTDSSTNSSDAGSESGAESGTETDGMTCGGFSLAPSFIPSQVMLVVDLSSSMLDGWDHDQDPLTPAVSRWQTTRELLEQLIPAIETYELGLQRFPAADACPAATADDPSCTSADVCLAEPAPSVAVGPLHGQTILAALPEAAATGPELVGGSPASAAFVAARDHLLAQPDEHQGRAILLFTDGGANCSVDGLPEAIEQFDAALESLIGDTFAQHGISTFVIGVGLEATPAGGLAESPDVDRFAALNALALAGGQPRNQGADAQKFFDAAAPDELIVATEPWGCFINECIIDLSHTDSGPPTAEQIPLVEISMDMAGGDAFEPVPYVSDCGTQQGWTWLEHGVILSFCGEYCDAFNEGASVEGVYGCPGNPGG